MVDTWFCFLGDVFVLLGLTKGHSSFFFNVFWLLNKQIQGSSRSFQGGALPTFSKSTPFGNDYSVDGRRCWKGFKPPSSLQFPCGGLLRSLFGGLSFL